MAKITTDELVSSFEEMTVHGEHEAALLSKHGIEHAHLPVFPPLGLTRRNVLQFGVLLATKEQVLVHAPTRDRIGAMVALLAGLVLGVRDQNSARDGATLWLEGPRDPCRTQARTSPARASSHRVPVALEVAKRYRVMRNAILG